MNPDLNRSIYSLVPALRKLLSSSSQEPFVISTISVAIHSDYSHPRSTGLALSVSHTVDNTRFKKQQNAEALSLQSVSLQQPRPSRPSPSH